MLELPDRRVLRAHLVGRARPIAEAAGGLLGLASVSPAEEETLETLEAAFGTVATSESLIGDDAGEVPE